MRIFTESDEKKFAEYGINRKFTAKVVSDEEVELNVKMPVPDDLLISKAGFHAVQGTRLEALDEDFYFQAPEGRRFSVLQGEKSKKATYYPEQEFPEYVIFNFTLEPLREILEVKSEVNFKENLEKLRSSKKADPEKK